MQQMKHPRNRKTGKGGQLMFSLIGYLMHSIETVIHEYPSMGMHVKIYCIRTQFTMQ